MLLRSRIAGAAEVPRELLLSLPVLTATGRQEIRVENYRGIQEYTQELIRINTRSGQIRLTGKRLIKLTAGIDNALGFHAVI